MCFLIYGELMTQTRYPDNCHPPPSRKMAPQSGLGFGSSSGLGFGSGGNKTSAPEENYPPVRVRGLI